METWYESLHNKDSIDNISNYTGDLHEDKNDWYIAPVAFTRDSCILETSNWESFLRNLNELKSEKDWFIKRTSHWACGWFEIILIRPNTPTHEMSIETENSLSDYPVIDEEDYSKRQAEYAEKRWEELDLPERVKLCQQYGHSIFSARHKYIPVEENYDIIYVLENDC